MGRESENRPLARAIWIGRSPHPCGGHRPWQITRAVYCRSGTKGRRPWCSPGSATRSDVTNCHFLSGNLAPSSAGGGLRDARTGRTYQNEEEQPQTKDAPCGGARCGANSICSQTPATEEACQKARRCIVDAISAWRTDAYPRRSEGSSSSSIPSHEIACQGRRQSTPRRSCEAAATQHQTADRGATASIHGQPEGIAWMVR